MTGETTRADLTRDAADKRARLFGFVEAGAEESDLPSFAAAIDDYIGAVTAIDTDVMEQADRECDDHIAAGRAFRQFAQQVEAWGQQHQARADRYRTRLDRVKAECTALMREVSGLSPVALAGRRDAVSRIQEAARPAAEAAQASAPAGEQPEFRQPAYDAVFAYIREQPRDVVPTTVVDRNAMIWRAVHAALDAVGVPSQDKKED